MTDTKIDFKTFLTEIQIELDPEASASQQSNMVRHAIRQQGQNPQRYANKQEIGARERFKDQKAQGGNDPLSNLKKQKAQLEIKLARIEGQIQRFEQQNGQQSPNSEDPTQF